MTEKRMHGAPPTEVPKLPAGDLYPLLVELANFDPELARPGDWLNSRVALDTLAGAGNAQMNTMIFNTGNPQRIGTVEQIQAEVKPIHAELRRLVRQFAVGGNTLSFTAKITAGIAVWADGQL